MGLAITEPLSKGETDTSRVMPCHLPYVSWACRPLVRLDVEVLFYPGVHPLLGVELCLRKGSAVGMKVVCLTIRVDH